MNGRRGRAALCALYTRQTNERPMKAQAESTGTLVRTRRANESTMLREAGCFRLRLADGSSLRALGYLYEWVTTMESADRKDRPTQWPLFFFFLTLTPPPLFCIDNNMTTQLYHQQHIDLGAVSPAAHLLATAHGSPS